jgi:hypothetical protein
MARLHITKFDAVSGEVEYAGEVDLGNGRFLSFTVIGNIGLYSSAWCKLKLDAYEGEDFSACVHRMADWLEAIAPALRGDPVAGPPVAFKEKP